MSVADLAQRRQARATELRHRVTVLEAEERRLYRILALALQVATADGRDCQPAELLELLFDLDGSDPARPAWVEEKERRQAMDAYLKAGDRFMAVLKEMA